MQPEINIKLKFKYKNGQAVKYFDRQKAFTYIRENNRDYTNARLVQVLNDCINSRLVLNPNKGEEVQKEIKLNDKSSIEIITCI